ncbi:MAG: hypothetical protein QG653_424 [Patescibacteria group bacterium]|nr:hypothetical protein [Patescibacteria group bacterium]
MLEYVNSETWLSGRRHLTANEARVYALHGFKSHRLRKNNHLNTNDIFLQDAELRSKATIILRRKIGVCVEKSERWMSGLNQRFTKPSFLYWDREFESRSLRKIVVLFTKRHILRSAE